MIKNSKLLDALQGKNYSGIPPIWLMRQAGRYMPEYRQIRQKHSFLEMCHNPELASEITLQPIRAFDLDAAIIFSDILVIPEALGVGLRFEEGAGPIIERVLNTNKDISNLPSILIEQLDFVGKAIKIVKGQLSVPLIGFAGGPFTVASYMIEGGSSRTLLKTKRWMLNDPTSFHTLLQKLTVETIAYVTMQIRSGADVIQIFDSWANVLSFGHFQKFCMPYLKQISDAIKQMKCPSIIFCRGSSVFAPEIAKITPSGISIDWNADLQNMRKLVPKQIALQGNLDPDILHAQPSELKNEVNRLLKKMHQDPSYIFNLGHGITPEILPERVKIMVQTVKNYQ